MDFVPCNEDHAIQTVTFALTLSRSVTVEDVQALVDMHDRVRSDLPALSFPNQFEPSVELAYRRPDGSATWALRLAGNEVGVECSRYTRWDKVWGMARGYLRLAIEACSNSDPETAYAFPALKVVDRFRALSVPYKLDTLLVRDPLIPAMAFESGAAWHSNVGWFAPLENLRVLNHLNLSGRTDAEHDRETDQIERVASVVIDHTQRAQVSLFDAASALGNDGAGALEDAMQQLHDGNKAILGRILAAKVRERIGLRSVS